MANGKRYSRVFDTKGDAKAWESAASKVIKLKSNPRSTALDADSLKEKYQELYDNPNNTVADIFDWVMEDLGLPCRYRHVVELAKRKKDSTYIPSSLRAKILDRDKSTCQMCGAKAPETKIEIDHVVPRSRGGMTEERNLRALCHSCNRGKSSRPYGRRQEQEETQEAVTSGVS
jgi:hypothetical protein